MTTPPHVLLAGAVLSGLAMATLAWQVSRVDASHPDRLVGELRLARWAAVLLAGVACIPVGLSLSAIDAPAAQAEVALGIIFVGVAGLVLQREPREGLLLAAAAFIAHALVNLAHRPGWFSVDLVPRWFVTACATYDVIMAALCYLARRR